VIYYNPDYRNILQEFYWQVEDKVPELVRVHRFLTYWRENIEAVIENVKLAIPDDYGQTKWRSVDWLGNMQ